MSDTKDEYNDFLKTSNSQMNDLDRDEDQFSFKASDSSQTHDIFIWKRTSSAVYFRFRISQASGNDKNIFLKWSYTANNDLMKSVQYQQCLEDLYTGTASGSQVTLKQDDKNYTIYSTDNDFKFKNFRTFTLKADFPAVFGLLYYQINKQFYDLKGNTVTNPAAVKQTYTITKLSADPDDQDDGYTSYSNRTFCLVNSTDNADYRLYSPIFTDILQADNGGSNLECDGSDSATLTVGTTDPETFNVATELANPD